MNCIKKFFLIFYLCLVCFPLLAEENFEFVKNPYIVKDLNFTDNDLFLFYWNDNIEDENSDIYIFGSYNYEFNIVRLNKQFTEIKNFISIEKDEYISEVKTLLVNDDFYFCYARDLNYTYTQKLIIKKVSLKTKSVETFDYYFKDIFQDTSGYSPISLTSNENNLYILVENSDVNNNHVNNPEYHILCFNMTNMTLDKTIHISGSKDYWSSMLFIEGKIMLYGNNEDSNTVDHYVYNHNQFAIASVDITTSEIKTSHFVIEEIKDKPSYSARFGNATLYQSNIYIPIYCDYNTFEYGSSMCFFCGYMILNSKGEMLYYKIVEQNGSDCSLLVDSTDLFFGISGGNFIKIYKIGDKGKSNSIEKFYTISRIHGINSPKKMLIATVNGIKQIVTIASSILYSAPVEENYYQAVFTNEEGFENSVLSPKAYVSNYGDYTFKFKYIIFNNEAPASEPVMYLYNNGKIVKTTVYSFEKGYIETDERPMNYYDDYNTYYGRIYHYTLKASEIGEIKETDNYSYRIKIGDKLSKEYPGPFYYKEAKITSYNNSYTTPASNITPNDDVFIQMTYIGTEGINLTSKYPRVLIYKNTDLTNPIEINNSSYTVLYHIQGSTGGYRASIGKLPMGEYTYKIIAQNDIGLENSVTGTFKSVSVRSPTITEYDGSYITPKDNINSIKEVYIQATCTCDVGVNLASEYPRVVVYKNTDLVNPIEINNSTYTVLYHIQSSTDGYKASIGKMPEGEYTYKIIAQNELGFKSSVTGSFESVGVYIEPPTKKPPVITEYNSSYITPKEDIIKLNTPITFQMRYTGDEVKNIADGYPRVYVYDNFNNIVCIQGKQYTVLSSIEGSENGYKANIGNTLFNGKYKYKIVAKNIFELEDSVEGNFSIQELTSKCYNAPNPFNPQAGERTKIFFEMPEDGSVEIDIYSEYGDKIYHTSIDGLSEGIKSIEYAGRDDRGDILYNGTYVCVVKKKYLGTTKKEKCRLLVIK